MAVYYDYFILWTWKFKLIFLNLLHFLMKFYVIFFSLSLALYIKNVYLSFTCQHFHHIILYTSLPFIVYRSKILIQPFNCGASRHSFAGIVHRMLILPAPMDAKKKSQNNIVCRYGALNWLKSEWVHQKDYVGKEKKSW